LLIAVSSFGESLRRVFLTILAEAAFKRETSKFIPLIIDVFGFVFT
jgi:hypothetical protein